MSNFFGFLDDIYGVLFLPQTTLTALSNRSVGLAGALVIVMVNLVEGLRQGSQVLLPQVLASLVGWFLLAVVLERLGSAFGKTVNLDRVLGLTGFASLPWLFFAPALNLGGSLGAICALAVGGWFIAWQGWAVAIALETQVSRVFTLVPLAFAGSVVSVVLLFHSFRVLLNISNLLHLS